MKLHAEKKPSHFRPEVQPTSVSENQPQEARVAKYTSTPMEFLQEQLDSGEITLNQYMMISQALGS